MTRTYLCRVSKAYISAEGIVADVAKVWHNLYRAPKSGPGTRPCVPFSLVFNDVEDRSRYFPHKGKGWCIWYFMDSQDRTSIKRPSVLGYIWAVWMSHLVYQPSLLRFAIADRWICPRKSRHVSCLNVAIKFVATTRQSPLKNYGFPHATSMPPGIKRTTNCKIFQYAATFISPLASFFPSFRLLPHPLPISSSPRCLSPLSNFCSLFYLPPFCVPALCLLQR